MTAKQWDVLSSVVAELCNSYGIPVSPSTVLSHAEVQGTLGIPQSGKWDYTRLSFDDGTVGAKDCGDKLRDDVKQKQDSVSMLVVATASSPEPTIAV
jgi:hypothetical protein